MIDTTNKNRLRLNSRLSNDKIVPFLQKCIDQNIKIRHLNIEFPEPNVIYGWGTIFKLLPKILLPNGKIFITTEDIDMRDGLEELALRYKFLSRDLRKDRYPERYTIPENVRVWLLD